MFLNLALQDRIHDMSLLLEHLQSERLNIFVNYLLNLSKLIYKVRWQMQHMNRFH